MEVIKAFIKTKVNGEKNQCNIRDDESLAENVQKYPLLYENGNDHIKRPRKENAWTAVEQKLGLEDNYFSSLTSFFFVIFLHSLNNLCGST